MDFTDKKVIVTGAAAGIGAACALEFAKHGADVVAADINADGVNEMAERGANETGRRIIPIACDMTDDAACADLLKQTQASFGRCDVLVNNAGVICKGGLLDLSPADFDAVLRVNLRSYFIVTQLVARQMVDQNIAGSIINMSSLNSVLAIPDQLAYVTSKGGVQQFTKAAALALAPHGVRVNAIGPGSIMTDILKSVMQDEAARTKVLSRTPLGRVGEPEEVARVAVFLASDYASYITGQTIYPDGGRAALNYTVPVA